MLREQYQTSEDIRKQLEEEILEQKEKIKAMQADYQQQINENKHSLSRTADRLDDLEDGCGHLESDKEVDRAVIVKMCHQYAYASTLVDECWPILEDMDPMPHRWYWPDEPCQAAPLLPPFNNHHAKSDKDTSSDYDDYENPEIIAPPVKEYPHEHYSH